jgi:hypothetical protein
MIATAGAGLACGCVMWLAFIPPRAFLERLRAQA